MKSSLRSLQRALGDTQIGGSSSGDRNTPKLQEKVDKTKQVGSISPNTALELVMVWLRARVRCSNGSSRPAMLDRSPRRTPASA